MITRNHYFIFVRNNISFEDKQKIRGLLNKPSNPDMKYLTFLDYTAVEARGKSIEAKLSEKDIEMRAVKEKYEQDLQTMREETNQRFNQIMSMIQHNPKLAQVKPESLLNKKL